MRIAPSQDATSATVAQIRRLVALLPGDGEIPLFVHDAGYDPIAIGHDLADARCEVLTRIRDDRVFYGDAPPRPNRPPSSGGRPPRHGRRWKCSDPTTWPEPSASLIADDPRYGKITVTAWHKMHPRLSGRGRWRDNGAPPIVRGSVIRVEVEHRPNPHHGRRRPSGCGGPARANRTSNAAGAPTYDASTSSTRIGWRRTPSDGPRRRFVRRHKQTAGHGSSSPH